MKKSLYEPRKLSLEEHKKIDAFLRYFHNEGSEVFDLLRQSFGDYEEPVIRMAKAVNLMSAIHQFCESKMIIDKNYSDKEYSEWMNLYKKIGLWTTSGWK